MPTYYFKIETTGLNPDSNKIIAIAFQKINQVTARPAGPLVVLKEWESSEREIIQRFSYELQLMRENDFQFVPVGYNLGFDRKFLRQRCMLHEIPVIDLFQRPFVDLRPVGIIANRGKFKGSGLESVTGKQGEGNMVPSYYYGKDYNKIISHIEETNKEFLRFAQWVYEKLPSFLEQYPKSES